MNHTINNIAPQLPASQAAQRPLGNTAKSSSPPSEQKKRRERFEALMQARVWLSKSPKCRRADVKYPGDAYRTHDCKWTMLGHQVYCLRDPANKAAHFGSLVTCGSVWACPVCASKIQQRRRVELHQLTSWVESTDRHAIMVTFTFPHTRIQTLRELLLRQREAFGKLRAGKAWVRIKASMGYQAMVRSLEITHGASGWHPHTHELWVLSGQPSMADRARLLGEIVDRWEKCCISAGLLDPADEVKVRAFRAHSVDIRWQVSCAEYLAKQDAARAWGVESELALSRTKKGRASGVHPHEFLVRQADGDASKYLEFVDATKEVRARQLYWSQGLKAACGVVDLSDEELADDSQQLAEYFSGLTADQWRAVRGNGVRAHVLEHVAAGDMGGFLRLLQSVGAPLALDQLQQLHLCNSLDGCEFNQPGHLFRVSHPCPAPLLFSSVGQRPGS